MTLRTNARLAGGAFLFSLAVGIAMLLLAGRPNATAVLTLSESLAALVLGVALYALTREQDPDLAMLALTCRVIQAIPGEGTVFFAMGSAIFAWLFLRGRMIPVALARLGVFASVTLVVILVLQRGGLFGGAANWASSLTWLTWMPMLMFEVTLALWLLVKGVATPATSAPFGAHARVER